MAFTCGAGNGGVALGDVAVEVSGNNATLFTGKRGSMIVASPCSSLSLADTGITRAYAGVTSLSYNVAVVPKAVGETGTT